MSGAKPFLIGYAVAYLVIAVTLNILLGPPGMSSDYLSKYKAEHDSYIDAVKRDEFKLWLEKPLLNPPDEALQGLIDLVQETESRPEFIAEQRRRGLYETSLNIFNALMFVLIVVRFGRVPFMTFVDAQVAAVRTRIEESDEDRRAAAERKSAAQRKLAGLEVEGMKMDESIRERTAKEKQRIEENTASALALLEKETEDRHRQEELLARQAMKEELVEQAIAMITERYLEKRSAETESQRIDEFIEDLGRLN